MLEVRRGFNYVRRQYSGGWPTGLAELRCDWCEGWHPAFRFENLHPLFRFLRDTGLCFHGNGSEMLNYQSLENGFMDNATTIQQGYKHGLTAAKGLAKAHKAISVGAVAKDLFLQPPITKLVWGIPSFVYNAKGFTLHDVFNFYLKMFCQIVYSWREELTEIKHRYVWYDDVRWREGPDYMEDWTTAIRFWEEIIKQIESIMSYIPGWQP